MDSSASSQVRGGAASQYLVLTTVVCGAVFVAHAIYSIFFHPLASFPGPRTRAVSILPWITSALRGRIPQSVKELHDTYGEVVRVGPNTLSFVAPSAWRDIYGHGNSRNFQKYNYPKTDDGTNSLLTADDTDHPRQRKLAKRAFSDKALKDQENLVKLHIDKLITHFRNVADGQNDRVVDVVKWFNYASFDLIGDLAFGEGFGCLDKDDSRSAVSTIIEFNRSTAMIEEALKFPFLSKLIMWLIPKKTLEERARHISMSNKKLHRRLASSGDRADFWSHILSHRNEENRSMTVQEMEANASLFLFAGSESTATALSGALYYVCKHPSVLHKLREEVRSAFKNEKSIRITSVQKLEYLHATLQESLRMYPPFPANIPRISVLKNASVAGYAVPRGTIVQIPIWPANTYSKNFTNAQSFIPERWIDSDKYHRDQQAAMQPFSIGPRNCIGQSLAWIEMKLILSHLIYNFDVQLADTLFEPEMQSVYIVWEKQPLNIRLTHRVVV